jgi:alkanesulfonate monooxygenase SsuD/methylene tetrahydromethanopterin reductase-like flavin-dependent oxidoreductase (luciferase family)
MRVGATIFNQNYTDWDRYEAEERGEPVAARPQRSDRAVFNEELDIARIADETGFDAVWTIEHHFTPYTMVTNPPYLSFIAGITRKVDLGTWSSRCRPGQTRCEVAEDVNMLDAFGRRARDHLRRRPRPPGAASTRAWHRPGQARDRFDESSGAAPLSRRAPATSTASTASPQAAAAPQPEARPLHSLWCAGGTDETVAIIARHNVRPLSIPTTSLNVSLETARASTPTDSGGRPPARPPSSRCGPTSPTASRGAPRRRAGDGRVRGLRAAPLRAARLALANLKGYESYGAMQKVLAADPTPFLRGFFDSHPWGTPAQTIKRATELAEAFGTDEIMFVFKYGGMPMAEAERSMRLFAREVMPALRDLKPEPIAA